MEVKETKEEKNVDQIRGWCYNCHCHWHTYISLLIWNNANRAALLFGCLEKPVLHPVQIPLDVIVNNNCHNLLLSSWSRQQSSICSSNWNCSFGWAISITQLKGLNCSFILQQFHLISTGKFINTAARTLFLADRSLTDIPHAIEGDICWYRQILGFVASSYYECDDQQIALPRPHTASEANYLSLTVCNE